MKEKNYTEMVNNLINMIKFNKSFYNDECRDFEVEYLITKGIDYQYIVNKLNDNGISIRKINFTLPDNNKINSDLDDIIDINEYNPKYRKIKDWSDFVEVHEYHVSYELDIDTGLQHEIIDLYYCVCDDPYKGDGYFYTTDNSIKEQTLQEYLDEKVFHRFDNNPYYIVRNIKRF